MLYDRCLPGQKYTIIENNPDCEFSNTFLYRYHEYLLPTLAVQGYFICTMINY